MTCNVFGVTLNRTQLEMGRYIKILWYITSIDIIGIMSYRQFIY